MSCFTNCLALFNFTFWKVKLGESLKSDNHKPILIVVKIQQLSEVSSFLFERLKGGIPLIWSCFISIVEVIWNHESYLTKVHSDLPCLHFELVLGHLLLHIVVLQVLSLSKHHMLQHCQCSWLKVRTAVLVKFPPCSLVFQILKTQYSF